MIRRIRVVAGVVVAAVALSASAHAQPQGLSPAEVEAVKKAVVDHIDKYYATFVALKPDVLAREIFHSPWIVIGGNGPQADMTVAQAQERFAASMKQLTESGWARSQFTTESVCVLNANAAIASGYNTRYKKDGSVMSVGGTTYVLGKSKDGWRIISYSGSQKGRLVRCD